MRWYLQAAVVIGLSITDVASQAQGPPADQGLSTSRSTPQDAGYFAKSGVVRFQLVHGRLCLDPPRHRKGSQSQDRDGVYESITVTAIRGIPSLHYVCQTDQNEITLSVEDAQDIRIESFHRSGWDLRAISMRDQTEKPLLSDKLVSARWAANARAVYFLDHEEMNLLKLPVDESMKPGSPRVLQNATSIDRMSFSRENRAAYSRGPGQSNLRLLDLQASTPSDRPLTTGTFGHGVARFSPDGRYVSFIRTSRARGAEIMIHSLESGAARTLYRAEACYMVAWSPDGTQILAGTTHGGRRRLVLIDVETGEFEIERRFGFGSMLAWSENGHVFLQSRDARGYHEIDLETATERRLFSDDVSRYLWQLEPSPDGRQIAILETESERFDGPRVLRVDLETREVAVLFEGLATPIGWSGDGEWVYLITETRSRPEPTRGGTAGPEDTNPDDTNPDDTNLLPDSPARIRPASIVRVSAQGAPVGRSPELRSDAAVETIAQLPGRGGMWSAVDITADGRWLVYDGDEVVSDIWIAENFDPEEEPF